MNSTSKKTFAVSGLFILFGAFSRLFTFLPNFSALETIALFGGAYIAYRTIAILIPLLAMFLSDLVINNTIARPFFPDHEGIVLFSDYMIWNAIAIVFIVLFGRHILKKVSIVNGIAGIFGATGIFWIVSNLGVWVSNGLYPLNVAGLIECFTLAIPFLKNSLAGNLVFGTLLFGSYEFYQRKIATLLPIKQEA